MPIFHHNLTYTVFPFNGIPDTFFDVFNPAEPANMSPHGALSSDAWLVPTANQYSVISPPALYSKVAVDDVNGVPDVGLTISGKPELPVLLLVKVHLTVSPASSWMVAVRVFTSPMLFAVVTHDRAQRPTSGHDLRRVGLRRQAANQQNEPAR